MSDKSALYEGGEGVVLGEGEGAELHAPPDQEDDRTDDSNSEGSY